MLLSFLFIPIRSHPHEGCIMKQGGCSEDFRKRSVSSSSICNISTVVVYILALL